MFFYSFSLTLGETALSLSASISFNFRSIWAKKFFKSQEISHSHNFRNHECEIFLKKLTLECEKTLYNAIPIHTSIH